MTQPAHLPPLPETYNHIIEHGQTHHRTHEPITPTQNGNAAPTHQSNHHKVQTHITTNKTQQPRFWSHITKSDPRIRSHQVRPTNQTHEADLTSWPRVRPMNLISPLNHNRRTIIAELPSTNKGTGESEEKREKWERKEKGEESKEKKRPLVIKKLVFVFTFLL